jgi:hypothetical protein
MRKSLMHSQSFGSATRSVSCVRGAVVRHVREVSEILRTEHLAVRHLTVILYAKHVRTKKRVCQVYEKILTTHTNDVLYMSEVARALLAHVDTSLYVFVKAGVLVRDVVSEGSVPAKTLFQQVTNQHAKIGEALDVVRTRYGAMIQLGAELGVGVSKMRQTRLSPRYTSSWREVCVVHLRTKGTKV